MDADVSQILSLARDFDRAGNEVGDKTLAAVKAAAAVAERVAKAKVHRLTGDTERSINTKIYGSGRIAGARAVVRADDPAGWYLEAGTVRSRPFPFMSPAGAAAEPGFVKAMEKLADIR